MDSENKAPNFLEALSGFNPDENMLAQNPEQGQQNTVQRNPEEVLKDPMTSNEQKMQAVLQRQVGENLSEEAQKQSAVDDMTNYHKFQKEVDVVNGHNKMAAENNWAPMHLPKLDHFNLTPEKVLKLDNPVVQQALNPAVAQNQQNQQMDALAKQQEDALKAQDAALKGQQKAQLDISDSNKQAMDLAIKQLDEKDQALDKIDANRFWNNRSTFQKILGTVAMAMGSTQVPGMAHSNGAAEMINKAIDQDINEQKLNAEQKLQMKSNALKRVQLEIEKFSNISQDKYRKAQLQMEAAKLGEQRAGIQQDLLTRSYIANAATDPEIGISKQEAEMILDPQQKERSATLPNGRLILTNSAVDKKNLEEQMVANSTAVDYAKKYKELGNRITLADKLSPERLNGLKRELTTVKQALIGSLRLPFTGPGILTETEAERLGQSIGDPRDLINNQGLFNQQIDGLINTLQTAQRASFRRAGVNIKPSEADQYREYGLKNNMDLHKVEDVIPKSGMK